MATQELARHRDRAGGESRDLVRGFERDLVDRRGIDDGVDEADLFGFHGRERATHDQERESPRIAETPRRQKARRRFGNETEFYERRRKDRVGGGDDVVA